MANTDELEIIALHFDAGVFSHITLQRRVMSDQVYQSGTETVGRETFTVRDAEIPQTVRDVIQDLYSKALGHVQNQKPLLVKEEVS